MKLSLYKLYRQFTLLLFLPLIATAFTGIVYGIGDRFFTLPDIITNILIFIHKGQFLGVKLVPIYVLLMGLGTFLICLVTLIERGDSSSNLQSFPLNLRPLVLVLVIPLALCVQTGVAYQLGKDWFGMSEQKIASFLNIHGGNSLGTVLGFLYTIITGLSLVGLAIIGYQTVTRSVVQTKQKKSLQQIVITPSLVKKTPIDEVASLKEKIRLGVVFFSLVLIGILYFGTSKILASIVIIVIIFAIPALIATEKLIQIWQQQKEIQAQFYEQENESTTILKAIPDSMLIVSQNGICLSYMPAKEAKFFNLDGDIIQKHLTDFLAPEIARQFFKYSQLSLSTGSTRLYRFPVSIDGKQQYHEARISPIGQTEVLIMVREITDINDVSLDSEQISSVNTSIQLLTEPELIDLLETILLDNRIKQQKHIMFCLAIEQAETNNNNNFETKDRLIEQITTQIVSYLSVKAIARIDEDELIILIEDIPSENISVLVDDLHHSLNNLKSNSDNNSSSVKFNLGLLEIDANSPDAVSLINLAKTTFKMAKQKVSLKTFW
jgi:GGDEF domain-containing protein